MMTYLYYAIGFLALFIAAILAIGAMQPIKHTASRSITLNTSANQVWSLLTQYADMPKWRKELLKVEETTDANGNEVWQEFENEKESLDFETIEQIMNIYLAPKCRASAYSR